MEQSVLMQFMKAYAKKAVAADWQELEDPSVPARYWLLGLLKIADPQTSDTEFPGHDPKERQALQKLITQRWIVEERREMRKKLKDPYMEPSRDDETLTSQLVAWAEIFAQQKEKKEIGVDDLLCVMIERFSKSRRFHEFLKLRTIKTEEQREQISRLAESAGKRHMLAQLLGEDIIGQRQAVLEFSEGVASALMFTQGLNDADRPGAAFIFNGPSGVGKSYLAERCAVYLKLELKRIDLSIYSQAQEVVRLMDPEGELASYVRRSRTQRTRSFFLFEHLDKAHAAVRSFLFGLLNGNCLQECIKQVWKEDEVTGVKKEDTAAVYNGFGGAIVVFTMQNAGVEESAAASVIQFRKPSMGDLLKIADREFQKCGDSFTEHYGIRVEMEEDIPALLLMHYGTELSAGQFRSIMEHFFRKELAKLGGYYGRRLEEYFAVAERLCFETDKKQKEVLEQLLDREGTKKRLLLAAEQEAQLEWYTTQFAGRDEYIVDTVTGFDQALMMLDGDNDIDLLMVILQDGEKNNSGTEYGMENGTMATQKYSRLNSFLRGFRKKETEIRLCVAYRNDRYEGPDLKEELLQRGVDEVLEISRGDDLLGAAERITREISSVRDIRRSREQGRKLNFITVPIWKEEQGDMVIRLREFTVM
ncbi:MAG: AAA family ATPase [Lachnospiraceae bacterium]|nr:AAA family ATPase [Lachnospiraceae bacterium]